MACWFVKDTDYVESWAPFSNVLTHHRVTIDDLKEKLKKLKDNLCDLEDMHSFTFGKTPLHIGADKAQNMQTEFEEECKMYAEQIAEVEKALQARDSEHRQ